MFREGVAEDMPASIDDKCSDCIRDFVKRLGLFMKVDEEDDERVYLELLLKMMLR